MREDTAQLADIIGSHIPNCQIKDGPAMGIDSYGKPYRIFCLGVVLPHQDPDGALKSALIDDIKQAAEGQSEIQVRSFFINDDTYGQEYEIDGGQFRVTKQGKPARRIYARLSFYPDNTRNYMTGQCEKVEGAPMKTLEHV